MPFDQTNHYADPSNTEDAIRGLKSQINALAQQVRQLQNALSVATTGTGNRATSVVPATASGSGATSITVNADSPLSVNGGASSVGTTFSFAFSSQAANTIFAAPDGSTGSPSFRAMVNDDLPDSGVTPGTATLLKLTGGGTDGSITVNAKGVVTALVAPT